MANKLSDAELMEHFFNVAKEIQNRCSEMDINDCENGDCPFSKDNGCIFGWHRDFNFPFDWKFGEEDES